MNNHNAYHGTKWEKPLWDEESRIVESMVFDLDVDHSDFKVAFHTESEVVASDFGKRQISDPDNEILALLKTEINADNVQSVKNSGPDATYSSEGQEFGLHEFDDRKALFDHLKESGAQAFVMEGDYEEGGNTYNDIAILDNDAHRTIEVKLLIEDEWTPWMTKDQGKEVLKTWANTDSLEEAMETAQSFADDGYKGMSGEAVQVENTSIDKSDAYTALLADQDNQYDDNSLDDQEDKYDDGTDDGFDM